ncbi:ATP-dependent DNA helicase RRM3-like [Asparagus officinalis]|uniref:ATP-dependent DNA helicase RRM3-like n=1 Tax=Asparagus officinalis TaxID=4686 RepID=UPI00098E4686|nr:ATP-dependent DNA helicase RRM3-like [Asparagus officinalis]
MIALATTILGVAAVIIPGGRTTHSRFKIKIPTIDSSMCSISKQDGTSKLIRIARLIIWDEAAMAKRVTIETLDRTLRDLMDQDEPFGGKVIVFGGDFRQVLPVVPRSTRSQTIKESLVSSHLWSKMIKLQLSKNMRAKSDTTFSEFLLRIGNGDEPTVTQDLIKLPNAMLIQNQGDDLPEDSLINSIFPSLDENFKSIDYMKDRAILATKNEYVDMLNDRLIKRFPGEGKDFYSFDEAVDDTNHHYQEEFLNTLLPNGLPPHKLMLKKYCLIILLRNLDPTNGLCNDVLAIIANVKPMIKYVTRYNKADTRQDIIIVDKDEITLSVTLFGDLAGNEGSIIEENMHETTIIALSDFKISLYKGEMCMTLQIASTICINPEIQLAKDMQEWHNMAALLEK